ncbi:MAG TPA: NB-ARC domain-containing protein [Micromonosporaceae bacterium]|nr:NB-ARC domain-containing protein [Micromonosporaceae bacterium]
MIGRQHTVIDLMPGLRKALLDLLEEVGAGPREISEHTQDLGRNWVYDLRKTKRRLHQSKVEAFLAGLQHYYDSPECSRNLSIEPERFSFTALAKRFPDEVAQLVGAARPDAAPPGRAAGLPAPYLTELFLPRPAVEENAIAALLGPRPATRGRIVALTGMSGAGKTLSAQHIAGQDRILARFPDGVFWLDARRTTATHWQRDILARIGGPVKEWDDLRALLQERLAGMRCLIVLDNLDSHEHDDAFTVVGPDSAVLVTTTDQEVLPHTVEVFPVGGFDLGGSLELLRRYSRGATDQSGEGASPGPAIERVLVHCGGLPLALAICGAMVDDGHRWGDVAALLDTADFGLLRKRFHDYPRPSLLAALAAGVRVLAPEEHLAYGELAVFAGSGPVPVAAAQRLWATRGLDRPRSGAMIIRLSRRSLLTYDNRTETFVLHELLYRYLVAEAGDDLPGMHGGLADRYLAAWGGLAAGLPDVDETDEYGVTQLAHHLEQAGRVVDLHALLSLETPNGPVLSGNRWFAVHDRAGWTGRYLTTLDRARYLAEAAADRDGSPSDRGLELRYALMTSSMISFAACVPAPLIAALVRSRVWSFAQGWTYAGMVTKPADHARALAALCRLPTPDGTDRALLLSQAIAAAMRLPTAADRAWALAAMIPFVTDAGRPALLTSALDAARQAPRKTEIWMLARLAGHLPDAVLRPLLDIAHGERLPAAYMLALAIAARHLPQLRTPLRTRIAALRQDQWRLCLYTILLAGAPPGEQAVLLADAHAAGAALHPQPGATILDLLPALLTDTGDSMMRREAIGVLLAELPAAQRASAADAVIARAGGGAVDAELLRIAFTHRPGPDVPSLVTRLVGESPSDLDTLCTLGPYLPHPLLAIAVDLACTETSESKRATALESLAPYLPADLLRRALGRIVRLDTPAQRARALVRLAPRLPATRRGHALAALRAVEEPDTRAELLVFLAPNLPATTVAGLADLVSADTGPMYRVMALTVLAMHVAGPDQAMLTAQAADAIRDIDLRRPELQRLTDGVTDPVALWSAVALQQRLDNHGGICDLPTLANLARDLPPTTVDRAVAIAHAITDPCDRSHAFASLVMCTSGTEAASMLSNAALAACTQHHHPDGTRCHIESALGKVAARVPMPDRPPLDVDTDIGSSTDAAAEHGSDWDRRQRQATCLAIYHNDHRPEPPRPQASDDGEGCGRWRRYVRPALAAAVRQGRPAVLSAAVDACLAEKADDDRMVIRLLDDLLAVQRWWPGGSGQNGENRSFVNSSGQSLQEMLFEWLRPEHLRERWLSERTTTDSA